MLFDERVGGPQLRVLQVAKKLRERGFETKVVFPRGEAGFRSLLERNGIAYQEMDLIRLRKTLNPLVHAGSIAKFWPNVKELRKIIRDWRADIVHTNGLMNVQAAMAAHLEKVKLVWHLNDTCTPRSLRALCRPMLDAWADAIALSARAVGDSYFPSGNGLDGRMRVLYAPVDTQRFRPDVDGSAVREEFGIPAKAPVIGMAANICPGKGHEYFLEAARRVKFQYSEAKFLIVGGKLDNREKFWSGLMELTAKLGLERDVFFTGRRNDVPQLLRAMTVCVQASESEACPMAMLEAMASGVPVVATSVGGTPELVADGITGILIEPRNAAQIAERVTLLLEAPEQARRMGLAGAERMREFFSLEKCVAAHMKLYSGLLGETQSKPREQFRLQAAAESTTDVYTRN